jgi:hypothetical protein
MNRNVLYLFMFSHSFLRRFPVPERMTAVITDVEDINVFRRLKEPLLTLRTSQHLSQFEARPLA